MLAGLPVTRAARTIGDLLGDDIEPQRLAQMTAEVIDRALDHPDLLAACIAPYAGRFGFRRGDGARLLEHLVDIAGYKRSRETTGTLASGE